MVSRQILSIILISSIVALSILGDALLYALLPANPEFFHIKIWQTGILLGANRFVRLITNELSGKIVQHSRSNRPLIIAVLIGGLITISYAFPFGFLWLLSGRLLWGACWSVLRVEGYTTLLHISTKKDRGKFFAFYQAIVRFGQGGAVLFGGLLSDLVGISFTYILYGALSITGGFILLSLRQGSSSANTGTSSNTSNRDEALPARDMEETTVTADNSRRSSLPLRLWLCGVSIAMLEQMPANLSGRLVADVIGPSLTIDIGVATLTGFLLGFRSFSSFLIGPAIGSLSDRIGRGFLLKTLMLCQGGALLGFLFFDHWIPLILTLVFQLGSGMSARLLIYILAGDTAPPETQAIHMGRFSTFIDLGTALGPLSAFALYAEFGFSGILPLAGILIILVLLFLPIDTYVT